MNLLLFLLAIAISQKLRLMLRQGDISVNCISLIKKKKLAHFHFILLKVSFFTISTYFYCILFSSWFLFLSFYGHFLCLSILKTISILKFLLFYFCFLHSFYSTLKLSAYTCFLVHLFLFFQPYFTHLSL